MESSDVDQQLEELRGGLQHQWQAVWRLLEATERQLEETARQEEEADVGLEAQCASLRAELELTREQLAAAEASAEEYGRELTALKRSFDKLKSKVTALLAYSKKERQRISDMYRAQNAALRKENESFRREHADLSARFQEREERLQQMLKEKALVVTELSDLMNRFCSSDEVRALEVSCTETPLDTTRSLDEDPEENISQDEYSCDDDASTGTDSIEKTNNNINGALDCDDCVSNTTNDTWRSRSFEEAISDMGIRLTHFKNNLTTLQANIECGEEKNRSNQSLIELLRVKLDALDSAFKVHAERKKLCSVGTLTVCEMVATTVARQASASCADCDARAAAAAASGDPASNISTTEWVLACMVLLMAVIVLGCWRGSFWMFRG